MMKVSELLVRTLKSARVKTVFGIPSVHNIGLYEALRKEPAIKHVLCRQEASATHMADGYARSTQGLGVVIASTGPGVGYVVAPLMEAWHSSSPVLVITSNISSNKIGKGQGKLHELIDQESLFKNITKAQICIRPGDDAEIAFGRAVDTALSRRPGPVYVEVPVNMWDKEAALNLNLSDQDGAVEEEIPNLEKTALELIKMQRPVIVLGVEAIMARVQKEITALAELLGAAVFTEVQAKGLISENHPLVFGSAQGGGARRVFEACDQVLAVGTKLRDVDFKQYGVKLRGLIHIDCDDTWINKNYPADLSITGDLNQIIAALRVRVEAELKPGSRKGWAGDLKRTAEREAEQLRSAHEEMDYLNAIRRVLPQDSTLVIDNTMLGYWAEYFYPTYVPGGLVAAKGSAIIGFAFPAAAGVKVAHPQRTVVAVTGDGGFLYGAQELATCKRHGINFIVIVVNDNAYGIIDYLQGIFYQQGHETGLVNPDFVAYAGAFGISAVRVRTPDELEDALQKALDDGEMCLIELAASLKAPFGLS
ncbi:MAG: thiamine pyrophosphate-binding protein [Desulfobacterales bacterium]